MITRRKILRRFRLMDSWKGRCTGHICMGEYFRFHQAAIYFIRMEVNSHGRDDCYWIIFHRITCLFKCNRWWSEGVETKKKVLINNHTYKLCNWQYSFYCVFISAVCTKQGLKENDLSLQIWKTLTDTIVPGGAQDYAYSFQNSTEVLGLRTTLILLSTFNKEISRNKFIWRPSQFMRIT